MSRPDCAAVLFDLDGTLVDSASDLMGAMNRLLVREGRAPVEPAGFRAVVSKGGRAMLAQAFADLDALAREALLPDFLTLYGERIAEHTRAFDGIVEVLDALHVHAIPWAVVSNKAEAMVHRLLARMPWAAACACVIGGDTLPVRKPDPAPLLEACRRMRVAAVDCVYVGDDERDTQAALAAGMTSVVALWGYRDPGERPADWGAHALIEAPRALLDRGVLARQRHA